MKLSERAEKIDKKLAELILSSWKDLKPIPVSFDKVRKFLIEANQIGNYLKVFEKALKSEKIAIVAPRGNGRSQLGIFLSKLIDSQMITPLMLNQQYEKAILDDAESILSGEAPKEILEAFEKRRDSIICLITDAKYSKRASDLGFKPMSFHLIFQPEKAFKDFLRNVLTLYISTEQMSSEFAQKVLSILNPLAKILVEEEDTIKEILSKVMKLIEESIEKSKLVEEVYPLRRQKKDVFMNTISKKIDGRISIMGFTLNISEEAVLKIDDIEVSAPLNELIEISNEFTFGKVIKVPKSFLLASLVFDNIKRIFQRAILIALLLRLPEKISHLGLEDRIVILSGAWLISIGYPGKRKIDVDTAITYFNEFFSGFKIGKLFNSVLEALSREGLIKKGKIIEFLTTDFNAVLSIVKKEILFRAKLFL